MCPGVPCRAAFVLLSLGSLFAGAASGQQPTPKRYALLVGVKSYEKHPQLRDLKYTENDAAALRKALTQDSSKKGKGFDEVVLLSQAEARDQKDPSLAPTAANVRKHLRRLEGKLNKGDVLLVSLAGHGMTVTTKEKTDENFFCPEDAVAVREDENDLDTLSQTMIPLGKLLKDWQKVVGVKLLLVDACRDNVKLEGARNLSPAEQPRLTKGTSALFSCNTGEFSYETDRLGGGHGIFTYYVVEALKNARNNEGEVTWGSLVEYVPRKVALAAIKYHGKGAQQTPHFVSNLVGATPVLVVPEGRVTGDDVFREALACYTGKGAEGVNLGRAYRLFKKAGDEGHVVAKATQAWMLHHGQGTAPDPAEARRSIKSLLPDLKEAARTDDAAQLRLGALYALGVGIEQDEKEAARLYRLAIAQKNSMAMNNLANLLMSGGGVEKDPDRGVRLYREAARFGEVGAMLNLGARYTVGAGVEKDLEAALAWYEKAAKLGSPLGLFELGKRYEQGAGVAKDEREAVRLFTDAADRDHPPAMNSLARMHEDGRGTTKDLKEAFRLYQRSAKRGYVPAMFNLGVCYRNGIGTAKDNEQAATWLREATLHRPSTQFERDVIEMAKKELAELQDKF
jgi:TPR repeat protein